jgi:hypothetical protein
MCAVTVTAPAVKVCILQDLYVRDPSDRDDNSKLRIVAGNSAPLHDLCRPVARRHPRAREFLEFRNTAGMIEMGVRVDDQLDVFRSKAKRADIR